MATEQPTISQMDKESGTTGASPLNGGNLTHRGFGDHNPHAAVHPMATMAAFGEFQPGLFKSVSDRKFANPAPLGLCAFALTTFVLSAVNLDARGLSAAGIAVPLAFGYGGLVQLLAGMWEMAVGNTFGATALSSYGGFWLAWGLLEFPWTSRGVADEYGTKTGSLASAAGIFLTGWFIFTTILLLCTLRSTVMFFLLFFTLDLAFLFLACSNYAADNGAATSAKGLQKAGGVFGMLAAFLAWYNAFAGIADSSNSFFIVPVFHFPWSDKAREERLAKTSSARVA